MEDESPGDLGLRSLPIRGSAGRHFEEKNIIPRGSRAPPEPEEPPRGHDDFRERSWERPRAETTREARVERIQALHERS